MTRTELEGLLHHLLKDYDNRGKIHVANIHGSRNLVEPHDLERFFEKCLAATTSKEAMDLFNGACKVEFGITDHHFGMKVVDMTGADPMERFATVVKTSTFHERHLSTSHPALHTYIPVPNPSTPDEIEEFAQFVDELNATGAWDEPGATLGRLPNPGPAAGHQICVWFTRERDVLASLGGAADVGSADEVRNALGLVDKKKRTSLLLYTFPASTVCPPNAIRVAQPTFADGGNERFAAEQPGTQYTANRSEEWGTTVHLRKYTAREADCCGLPERVANPIPIVSSKFRLHYLGCLLSSYDSSAADDDLFAKWLMRGIPEPDVVRTIVDKVLV